MEREGRDLGAPAVQGSEELSSGIRDDPVPADGEGESAARDVDPGMNLPGGLSDIQVAICRKRMTEHKSYSQLRKWLAEDAGVRISGNASIEACLKRAAYGVPWEPGCRGGAYPFLCHDDVEELVCQIRQRSAAMNGMTMVEACLLVDFMRARRNLSAAALLEAFGCPTLAANVRVTVIEAVERKAKKRWLKDLVKKRDVHLRSPEPLEKARRKCCNSAVVKDWFKKYSSVLRRDERLIINADETHISSDRKFKVLTPKGRRPVRAALSSMPHFSAMLAITASGHRFNPMYILPEIQELPEELTAMAKDNYFVSTSTGWMTQRAFLYWSHFMIREIELYRAKVAPELAGQRMLLILDGHGSRWTYEAMRLFDVNHVDVLILPPHSTHVLQPFDVSVAGPLKTAMAKYRDISLFTVSEDEHHHIQVGEVDMNFIREKRELLFRCFSQAWSEAANLRNIQSGFRACGISPLDVEAPLRRGLTEIVTYLTNKGIDPQEPVALPRDLPPLPLPDDDFGPPPAWRELGAVSNMMVGSERAIRALAQSGVTRERLAALDPVQQVTGVLLASSDPFQTLERRDRIRNADFSGRLVTDRTVMGYLKRDHSLFPVAFSDMHEQFRYLMYAGNAGGRYLDAPSGFVWQERECNSKPGIMARVVQAGDDRGWRIWQLAQRVGAPRILFLWADEQAKQEFVQQMLGHGQDPLGILGMTTPRTFGEKMAQLMCFLGGQGSFMTATYHGMRKVPIFRRVMVVYDRVPEAQFRRESDWVVLYCPSAVEELAVLPKEIQDEIYWIDESLDDQVDG
jgi:hypothetical protein